MKLNKNRFHIETIILFGNEVKKYIQRTKSENITSIEAISISVSLEKGLIEKNFFQVYETDDISLQEALRNLEIATQIHLEKVEEFWHVERKKLGLE